MTTLSLPAAPTEGGLARYFREAWKFPLLGKEEEQMLAIRWRDQGDVDAAHRLVTSHLRLVVKIAMKYRGYGLPMADLISEGNIGLMKAVRKFDPDRDFRLSTYAMWWIKASVVEHVMQSWSMVKMGAVGTQKKLFFKLYRLKERLRILDNGELSPEQAARLSEAVNVPTNDIVQMNRRISVRDQSLNAPLSQEGNSGEFQDQLADGKPSAEASLGNREETELRSKILATAIAELPKRERHIFTARRLIDDRPTLEQLGAHYGITHERVRQIEVQSFERVKKFILNRMPADAVGFIGEQSGPWLTSGA